jgi:Flp pilus assembly protein TadG
VRRRAIGRDRRRRGQALVEFALILPLLILLMVGILDFGRAIFAYNSVSNAARTATRVAIVNQHLGAIEQAARAEAVTLEPLTVDVTYEAGCTTPEVGCIVTVAVEYTYQSATPIIGSLVGDIVIGSDAKMPVEREFSAPPP